MAAGMKPQLQLPNIVLLNKLEILVIIYSYYQDVININFDKLINKLSSNIKCWYSRSLTLYGRIVLFKSLVCSTLQYVGQVFVIPEQFLKVIENIIWKFIWKVKKRGKIKRLLRCKDFDGGGLRMVDVRSVLKTIKILCMKRLLMNKSCIGTILFNEFLCKYGHLELLIRCNYDLKKLISVYLYIIEKC